MSTSMDNQNEGALTIPHYLESVESRSQSLENILREALTGSSASSTTVVVEGSSDGTIKADTTSLCKALVALGEATAHIAVHLQDYVNHAFAGSQNASGDDQLQLDIHCDEAVFEAVRASGVYSTVASEETPQETTVGDGPFSE